jgi:hypothetical protein
MNAQDEQSKNPVSSSPASGLMTLSKSKKYIFWLIPEKTYFPDPENPAGFTPENRALCLYDPDTNNTCENSAQFYSFF